MVVQTWQQQQQLYLFIYHYSNNKYSAEASEISKPQQVTLRPAGGAAGHRLIARSCWETNKDGFIILYVLALVARVQGPEVTVTRRPGKVGGNKREKTSKTRRIPRSCD